jgi:hypothetical protein
MKAYQLTLAAAAAGLLLAASGEASAATLSPTSFAAPAIYQFDGKIEPVHYRRPVRRYHSPYYRRGPVIGFGYSAYPYGYYPAPYYRPYAYPYYGGYPYGYGYGPTFNFGFRLH